MTPTTHTKPLTAFGRVGPAGFERPVVRIDDEAFDLTPIAGDLTSATIADGGLQRMAAAARSGDLPRYPSTACASDPRSPTRARSSASD